MRLKPTAAATLKVALIGCGRIAGHHARSINKTRDIELSAVCDIDVNTAYKYQAEFSVPAYNNYHQMLQNHPEIDIVAIITPSGMHFEHAYDIMQNYQKNIIVEKPTFMRPEHVIQAYQIAESNNLAIFPVFQNRYNKAVLRVKNAIIQQELGDIRILSVRVRWNRDNKYYQLAPWRGTFAMDGGALTNQGIHHIDLLQYFGGSIKQVNVLMATLGADIEVEDSVVANLEYGNNKIGNIEITTAARPHDYEASISIVGSKGLAQIGGIAVNELQIFTPNPDDCELYSEDFSGCVYGNGHQQMYQDIVNYFQRGINFPVSKQACFRTIQFLHACYYSNEIRDWVDVKSSPNSKILGCTDLALAQLYRINNIKGAA